MDQEPPDDMPDILHAFGQLGGGYDTALKVYPHAALEPHVIDTFGGDRIWSDDPGGADATAMIPSIESAIGPLPVLDWPGARDAIQALKGREYIRVKSRGGRVVRELVCTRHQMLGIGTDIQGTADGAWSDGDILLLQIDSDKSVHEHFMFCDMGVAQYWIRPADLAEARFDKAWATTAGG
jgi:hypothetical protein